MSVKNIREKIIEILSSSPKSIQDLLQLLRIPERTLRYHLSILRRQSLIEERFSFLDMRKKLLTISKKKEKAKELISSFGPEITFGIPKIERIAFVHQIFGI